MIEMPAVFERQGLFLGGFYIINVVGPSDHGSIIEQKVEAKKGVCLWNVVIVITSCLQPN